MPAKKTKKSTDARIEDILAAHDNEVSPRRIFKIMAELVSGFEFLSQYGKAATIFGTARCTMRDKIYKDARNLAFKLAKSDFAVITGGGPGIMEAANKGAYDAGGKSIGLNIKLPHEQRTNKYVMESESFHYFFTRKVMLAFASEVYIFFPGGFGTLDEFFEMITLIQTNKIPQIPVVLVNKAYWSPLLKWMESDVYGKYQAIDKQDMNIYHLVNNANEAMQVVKKTVK